MFVAGGFIIYIYIYIFFFLIIIFFMGGGGGGVRGVVLNKNSMPDCK